MTPTRRLRNKANRCAHGWCSDCKTRRGRNRGNRAFRRNGKNVLRKFIGKVTS